MINPMIIDIIVLLFFIFMAILGFKKGFVVRLYDLITLIIVFFLTYIFSEPLSYMIHIYQYDVNDIVMRTIGSVINRICVMVILFIVLLVIKKLIGLLLKPLLQKIVEFFALTEWIDRILGFFLGISEALLIAYIVLLMFVSPFFPQGREALSHTMITQHLLKVIPSVSEDFLSLPSYELHSFNKYSHDSLQSVMDLVLLIEDYGLVDEQQVVDVYNNYIKEHLNAQSVTLTHRQKQQFIELLQKVPLSNEEIEKIINKVSVSE